MSIYTIVFIVSFLGAIIDLKKTSWAGGIAGIITAPFLMYFSISSNILLIAIGMLIFFLLGLAFGFVCSIIYSGLKGSGHNTGPTYGSGFGAHHPGGIILSDEERKGLMDRKILREVIISY